MIRKLIHSSFEIDLSNLKLNIVRENHWFSDTFFTKFSFPFELELTDELDALLGFISRHNSKGKITYIECKYYHGDVIEDAIFEVLRKTDRISCELSFGYDQLPSFTKKLAELPLDKFELPEGVDIYNHAETIIPQSWPDVNYNFPQIHTDKIDPESDDVFIDFEKIINNYKDGEFLINEVIEEGGESIAYNRNIMQPLPAALHILKKGFEDAGLTLEGEILDDERISKALVFADVDYATTVTQESETIITMSEDFTETGVVSIPISNNSFPTSASFNRYLTTVAIDNPGRYRVIGKVNLFLIPGAATSVNIKYRNQIIWQFNFNVINSSLVIPINVNVVFDTLADLLPNTITIESYQRKTTEKIIFDLAINPIRLHDAEGNAIPTIINRNEIDLTKSVPDMLFEDFVKVFKNWFNYGLDVVGSVATMYKVKNKIRSNATIDLSEYDVKFPQVEFSKGTSFLLKFADVDSADYKFLKVFQSIDGVKTSSFKEDDKTTSTEINALPLPLLVRNGVQTAHAFEQNNSKPYFVIYDGLTNGLNLCKDPSDLLLPAVHAEDHEQFNNYRINAEGYIWNFTTIGEKLLQLKPQSTIFAYGKNFVVKTINDTEVSPGIFDIEIDCLSLE